MKGIFLFFLLGVFLSTKTCEFLSVEVDIPSELSRKFYEYEEIDTLFRIEKPKSFSFELENENGSISLWKNESPREIRIEIRKKGFGENKRERKEVLESLTVSFEFNRDRLRVKGASERKLAKNKGEIDFDVYLPEELYGIKVHTINGRIRVERLKASKFSLSLVNGGIEVDGKGENFMLRTINGTISGKIEAGECNFETTNGSIRLSIKGIERRGFLKTVNGSIDLRIAPIPIKVEAITTHGTIKMEGFEILEKDSKRILGASEKGGASLFISTVNGNIKVRKGGMQ